MDFGAKLPSINACFNALTTLLILAGWREIRRKQVDRHRRCMLAAFASSTLFLVGYLVQQAVSKPAHFGGTGALRKIYFAILGSHTLLAVVVLPLVLRTLFLALKGRLDAHRRLARITLPIWLYVSFTGVVVWWMLFSGCFPQAPPS